MLVCRMISPQYFVAIALAPEGNFGKARYLARLATPTLVAAALMTRERADAARPRSRSSTGRT